jgi:hypothetical protein
MNIMVAIDTACEVSPQVVDDTIHQLDKVSEMCEAANLDARLLWALARMLEAARESGHILISVGAFPKERDLQPQPERRN